MREENARPLNEFSDVCKCSVVESKDPAKDVGRNTNLLKLVNQFPKLARSGDLWETCQEAFRIMKEGTGDEMERHIARMTQETRLQRLEDRSGSHKTPLVKSCASVLKVEPRCFIKSLNQRPGVEVLPCEKKRRRGC